MAKFGANMVKSRIEMSVAPLVFKFGTNALTPEQTFQFGTVESLQNCLDKQQGKSEVGSYVESHIIKTLRTLFCQ